VHAPLQEVFLNGFDLGGVPTTGALDGGQRTDELADLTAVRDLGAGTLRRGVRDDRFR
jgi:hypothetical protein